MDEKVTTIYTGANQWEVENAGYCEYCRRQSYCTKILRKGGCRAHRERIRKEDIKKRIEEALSTGLTPEQLRLTPEIIKKYNIEIPETPEIETLSPDSGEASEEMAEE